MGQGLKENYSFVKKYATLTEILTDHKLASFGDAYVNFVYSLATSNKKGEPSGAKVRGALLAEALKKAGLREYLPSRMTRHKLADAAEALIAYAWLKNHITLKESVSIIEDAANSVDGFEQLLAKIRERIKLS